MEQILIFNSILYFIAIYAFYYKSKTINMQIIAFSWYFFISICGIIAIHLNIYYNIYGYKGVPINNILPFCYVILLFYILTNPLKKITINNNNKLKGDLFNLPSSLFKIIYFIVFLYLLLKIYELGKISNMSFGDIYTQLHEEGKAIISYTNPFILKLSTSGYMIYSALFPFLLYYLINKIIQKKNINNKTEVLLLISVLLIKILEPISTASRGGLIFSLFDYLFFLILFWSRISTRIKNRIVLLSISSISLIFVVLVTITSDRVGADSEYIFNSFILYLGETFPNVLYRYWDHVEFHPMGERLFGINDYGSLGNFFEYWNIRLKVATECFKTLPIDLYIEFGKIGAIIFLLILSYIFKKVIGKDGIKIWSVGLAFWYYQLCISGIFSFAKRGETNYKILFLIIVFSIYLYIRKERALNKI